MIFLVSRNERRKKMDAGFEELARKCCPWALKALGREYAADKPEESFILLKVILANADKRTIRTIAQYLSVEVLPENRSGFDLDVYYEQLRDLLYKLRWQGQHNF
jgi:hypothetical protein